MSVEHRLIQTDGYAVLSGVQMLVKAALESGVDTLVGAQLDSPSAYTGLLVDQGPLLEEKGLRCLIQPDARQAVSALVSAWVSGSDAIGVFDAAGVIDAAGALLMDAQPDPEDPGSVLLCLQESDGAIGEAATALLRRCGWLVIEPALQDEVKSFAAKGLALSRHSSLPVVLALPASLCNGAATVACKPNIYPGSEGEGRLDERANENVDPLPTAFNEARQGSINTVVNPPGKDEDLPLALITVGRAFGWARQAMAELGLAGRLPMLRLGMVAPLDERLIVRHVESCQNVVVLDPSGLQVGSTIQKTVEQAMVAKAISERTDDESALHKAVPTVMEQPVITVADLRPDAGPGGVIEALTPMLRSHPTLPRELVSSGLERTRPLTLAERSPLAPSIAQPPTRSELPPPGSSLVDLSVVLGRLRRDLSDAQLMLEQHRRGPIDLAVFGELDDAARMLLAGWGDLLGGLECEGRLAGAAAAGAAPDPSRCAVVLMTSRRFFSLGSSAIADAVRAGRNAVFVIHTEDPAEAVGPRRRWRRKPKTNTLDMQAIVESIQSGRRKPAPSVSTIDPADRPRMRRLLERLVLSDGVHVVIARRRRGPRYYRKASEVHQKQSARRGYVAKQGCLVHCPEAGPLTARRRIELGVLGVEPTRYGPDPWTVSVSWSWHDQTVMNALGDPAVGLAVLERSQPERSRVVPEDLDNLPAPPTPIHANKDAWRATLVGISGTAMDLSLDLLLEAGASMGYLVRSTANALPADSPTTKRADVLFTRHQPEKAPHVPSAPGRANPPTLTAQALPGHADLMLATELTEAARLVTDLGSPFDPAHTYALIDTLLIPDLQSIAAGSLPDREALTETVQPGAQPDGVAQTTMLPIARLAEWFWGHQRYAAWVYLGYLVQRGLVPLTTTAIDAAGQRVLGITDPRSSEAVRVGRKLAIDPGYADRVLQIDPPDIKTLLKTSTDDIAEHAGSRRGTSVAGEFQSLLQPLLDQSESLDDDTRREIIRIAQRCFYWAGNKKGLDYCRKFIQAMTHIFEIDNAYHGFALTRDAVRGLEKAMLIPDEIYLASMLTAPQRYRRDRRRLNISLERDDKISYVHLLRPEFDLFNRRVGFTVTLGERALSTVAGLHVLRRIRPGWYRTQRDFRDAYIDALLGLSEVRSESDYRYARDCVNCTTGIAGRGDVRRETVNKARRQLEKMLNTSDSG